MSENHELARRTRRLDNASVTNVCAYAYDATRLRPCGTTARQVGNVTGLVGTNGTNVATYAYDAFGNTIGIANALAEANPFRFSSKYFDAETGLYYYGLRYCSPSLGRWLSRDPIGEAGGLPLYGCVRNDPADGIDPLGLAFEFEEYPHESQPMRKELSASALGQRYRDAINDMAEGRGVSADLRDLMKCFRDAPREDVVLRFRLFRVLPKDPPRPGMLDLIPAGQLNTRESVYPSPPLLVLDLYLADLRAPDGSWDVLGNAGTAIHEILHGIEEVLLHEKTAPQRCSCLDVLLVRRLDELFTWNVWGTWRDRMWRKRQVGGREELWRPDKDYSGDPRPIHHAPGTSPITLVRFLKAYLLDPANSVPGADLREELDRYKQDNPWKP